MTRAINNSAQFFVAGGSLRPDTPSYVVRPADRELIEHAQAGAFCYVLTARQMGKSSLMVRTAARLQEQGFKIAVVDLTSIGTAAPDEWYLSLLTQISRQLNLKTNVQEWWRGKRLLSVSQRFIDFLHDVVLAETSNQIVLFIDEIDTMLRLSFRDDFFAAIRAIYNGRAKDSLYRRLTFVLLGVATPIDLVQDARRTPFNIGNRIELNEFSYADAEPLRQGLESHYPGQADRILKRIFVWTNGHPYLTQKLCLTAADAPSNTIWDESQVDRLVDKIFVSERGARDANLTFVRNSLSGMADDERREMLAIYSLVYSGQAVTDDESSPAQNHLELFGLVRVERGKLYVRNGIYRRVFDEAWIKTQLSDRPARNWFSPLTIIVLAVALFGGGGYAGARAIGLIGRTPTSVAIADTATSITTLVPPQDTPTPPTPAPATAILPTSEPPTPVPPTDTPPTPVPPTDTPPTPVPPTDTPVLPTDTPVLPTPKPKECFVISAVSMRREPVKADNIIKSLPIGTKLNPQGQRPGWTEVQEPDGAIGWIGSQFIGNCNFDITTLPPK